MSHAVARALAWRDVPVTTSLTGSLTLVPTQEELAPLLALDRNGDGSVDQALKPSVAGELPTDPLVVLSELKAYVSALRMQPLVKRLYLAQISLAEWYVQKGKTKQALHAVQNLKTVAVLYAKLRIISVPEMHAILEYLATVERLLTSN